jgi:nitroreductase
MPPEPQWQDNQRPARLPDRPTVTDDDIIQLSDELIHTRQHIGPKHLVEPAPDAATLRELFAAAAAAPDHGQLRPWRFLVLGDAARQRLSEVFVEALLARDPDALPDQIDDARKKAFRGPVLILAIADLRAADEDVAPFERLLSLGCAIQNLLLAARARGYGSGLSGGRALRTDVLRQAFGIAEGEHAICFISLGTPTRSKPIRPRPAVDDFVRWV